jgi:hypothetical protein
MTVLAIEGLPDVVGTFVGSAAGQKRSCRALSRRARIFFFIMAFAVRYSRGRIQQIPTFQVPYTTRSTRYAWFHVLTRPSFFEATSF